jgi:hypothetical protein
MKFRFAVLMLLFLMQHHYIPVCVPEAVFLTTAAFISNQNIGEPCDKVVSIVKSVTPKDTHPSSDT